MPSRALHIDYDTSDWQVLIEEGEEFSAEIGAAFFQMSAKTGEGVTADVLADMASLVLLRRIRNKAEHGMQEKLEERDLEALDILLESAFWSDMKNLREYDLDNYTTVPRYEPS